MADIKTPLCALQPTPAIPHTASRSGAGTRRRRRGGGGGARARGQAPARSARPANPRSPLAPLPAPGCSRPPPAARPVADGTLGRREPTSQSSSPWRAHVHFLTLAPYQRRFLTGGGAGELPPSARQLCERQGQENGRVARSPRGRRPGRPHPRRRPPERRERPGPRCPRSGKEGRPSRGRTRTLVTGAFRALKQKMQMNWGRNATSRELLPAVIFTSKETGLNRLRIKSLVSSHPLGSLQTAGILFCSK